jgi:hypothetical protein
MNNLVKIVLIIILIIATFMVIDSLRPVESINGSIWIHSYKMHEVDIDKIHKQNVTKVYLYYQVIEEYSDKEIQNFIQACHDKDIKVHIWIGTFRYNKEFYTPTPTLVNERLKLVENCSNIPNIDGIILDYVRYSGKNPNVVDEKLITDFVKKARKITNNKNLELSVCLMPEKSGAIEGYGQNAKELSKHVDTLIPMVYKGNYNQNTSWIKETTKWYVNIGNCKVEPAIMNYRSDDDKTLLTFEELRADYYAIFDGGAKEYSLFTYEYTTKSKFLGIY